eukprot:scaffold65333_cov30-Tisochrysis_lutea.AAC.3
MGESVDLELAVESLVERSPRLKRPIASFFCLVCGAIVLFVGRGPLFHLWEAKAPRRATTKLVQISQPPPPPPPLPAADRVGGAPQQRQPSTSAAGAAGTPRRSVDAPGAADPGGAPRVHERSPLIQGMIESGFSREQAEVALAAVNATDKSHIPKAIE